jgi:transposase
MRHTIELLRAEGWSYRDIANAFEVAPITIYRWHKPDDRLPRSEKSLGRTKNIARAKQLRASGMLFKQIAYELNVSLITAHRWSKL